MFVTGEPTSFAEATNDERHDKWEEAMKEDICVLREHDLWQLVPPQTNKQDVVKCKWVFRLKPKTNATAEKYIARLVAKEFQQKAGLDFNETLAPVAKLSLIRLLLAHTNTLSSNVM